MRLTEVIWTITSAIVGIGVPLGFGIVLVGTAATPGEVRFARYCFIVPAIALGATEMGWLIHTNAPWWWRAGTGLIVGALIFVGTPEALRWVQHRQKIAPAQLARQGGVNTTPTSNAGASIAAGGSAGAEHDQGGAPKSAPPIVTAQNLPPPPPAVQARLRRLVVYEAPVLNLLDPKSEGGPQILRIVNMPIRNAGDDTIKLWVEFVLYANDREILHYRPGPETIVQQTQEARFPGQQFDREIPPEATELKTEVTVTYDTIPESGRRTSRRTFVYALERPNGPDAPAALGVAVNTRQSEN